MPYDFIEKKKVADLVDGEVFFGDIVTFTQRFLTKCLLCRLIGVFFGHFYAQTVLNDVEIAGRRCS